jgi:predicted RNase H-like HicB family nuclease
MENKYQIILYWSDEDEAVIAEVPELAGCVADGTNYSEAIVNVEIVIEQWIQTAKDLGRKIPTPKGKLLYT